MFLDNLETAHAYENTTRSIQWYWRCNEVGLVTVI